MISSFVTLVLAVWIAMQDIDCSVYRISVIVAFIIIVKNSSVESENPKDDEDEKLNIKKSDIISMLIRIYNCTCISIFCKNNHCSVCMFLHNNFHHAVPALFSTSGFLPSSCSTSRRPRPAVLHKLNRTLQSLHKIDHIVWNIARICGNNLISVNFGRAAVFVVTPGTHPDMQIYRAFLSWTQSVRLLYQDPVCLPRF